MALVIFLRGMNVGDLISIDGYFTQDKFLAGRTLSEIERALGYQKGRLAHGAFFAVLMELPNDFELAALLAFFRARAKHCAIPRWRGHRHPRRHELLRIGRRSIEQGLHAAT